MGKALAASVQTNLKTGHIHRWREMQVCRQTILQIHQSQITFLPVHTYPSCVSPNTLNIRMHSACAVSFIDTSFIFLCSDSPPSLSGCRAEGLPLQPCLQTHGPRSITCCLENLSYGPYPHPVMLMPCLCFFYPPAPNS